jgi:hypothetical protein
MLFGPSGAAVNAKPNGDSTRPRRASAANIITDRLTGRDLRRWNAIQRIIFAEDADGQPLHPMLRSLWDQLQRSGHTIYIEMRDSGRVVSNTAGVFLLERFDPEGVKHIAVIRLFPGNIDRAYTGPAAERHEGFVPFQGLSKEERYAEVFGHEMAHAVDILGDLARAERVQNLVQMTNDAFLAYGRKNGYAHIEPEMQDRINKRDAFLLELEEPAEAAELVIWKEIRWSRDARNKTRSREVFARR